MTIGSVSQLLSASVSSSSGLAQRSSSASSVQAAGADFANVLAQFSSSALDTLKQGEAMSIAGIEGKTSVQQVVESVVSAEQTLQAVVAIRDKAVAAYQQISQMAI
jgi:flagellar hook-basal body complex protein FliE